MRVVKVWKSTCGIVWVSMIRDWGQVRRNPEDDSVVLSSLQAHRRSVLCSEKGGRVCCCERYGVVLKAMDTTEAFSAVITGSIPT